MSRAEHLQTYISILEKTLSQDLCISDSAREGMSVRLRMYSRELDEILAGQIQKRQTDSDGRAGQIQKADDQQADQHTDSLNSVN